MIKGEFTKYKSKYLHANSYIPTGFLISSNQGSKWVFYVLKKEEQLHILWEDTEEWDTIKKMKASLIKRTYNLSSESNEEYTLNTTIAILRDSKTEKFWKLKTLKDTLKKL